MSTSTPRQIGAACEWRDSAGSCAVAGLAQGGVDFDRLLADLSVGFVNLAADKVDAAITDSLRRISELLGVDRTQLIRFARGRSISQVTHSGATHGVLEGSPGTLASLFPWAIPQLQSGHSIVFGRLDDLPKEAAVDRATYQHFKVKAGLVVPLSIDGAIEGAVALDCERSERHWPPDVVERMQLMATIFGSALAHKRAREALDAAMDFERMASRIVGELLVAPRAQQDQVLEAGLREVAQAFSAERATLWQRAAEGPGFTSTHRWFAEGASTQQDPLRPQKLPWINHQLEQGSVVRFGRLAELPLEAAVDMETLHSLDIAAAVVVPLELAGNVTAAMSIATSREPVDWPDGLVPRAQLLGKAFASFLARQQAEQREREAQAQATHAARVGSMGVFAASLVHELTQPLAASLANAETAAELLALPAPELDELRETVADIVVDSRRAGELIQKLRRFLRHGEAERAEIELQALLTEVMGFLTHTAAAKGIDVDLDVPAQPLRFVADRVQLQQVLLNLLLNAFDAVATCPAGTRQVQLRARADDSALVIEVKDRGVGMDEATCARIFQPFFTTKPGGMGLGLSICQTIVGSHGGTLTASSKPGQGSCFRLMLPMRQPLLIATAPSAAGVAVAGDTVFVIDDDDAMRRALERQLVAEGYRVRLFANAHAFLDQAPQAEVACILSDVRMPGLSGLDLQATLAQAKNAWPMVFISGHADVPTSVQAMKAGAVAFLAKPFAKAELMAAVADALASSRQQVQHNEQLSGLRQRHRSLTAREAEVFALVVQGLLNKQVADRLGIAERTVKIHRARVMEKMQAGSLAELVRMAQQLGEARVSLAEHEPV